MPLRTEKDSMINSDNERKEEISEYANIASSALST